MKMDGFLMFQETFQASFSTDALINDYGWNQNYTPV